MTRAVARLALVRELPMHSPPLQDGGTSGQFTRVVTIDVRTGGRGNTHTGRPTSGWHVQTSDEAASLASVDRSRAAVHRVHLVHLEDWIGRTETAHDVVTAAPLDALSATLDLPRRPGDVVPPLWHWLYFLPKVRQSQLDRDGHPRRGDFLPPIELPRRMWAGGRLAFHAPMRVGDAIARTSTITAVRETTGRTGRLAFVTVRHAIASASRALITDEQDLVYRGEAGAPGERPPAPPTQAWSYELRPDPTLLFRYSALTFNAHRIHYDHPYAVDVEHHAGLVVHGPLLATLLAELARREQPRPLETFRYRATSPLFAHEPLVVCGEPGDGSTVRLWARSGQGVLGMEATAELTEATDDRR